MPLIPVYSAKGIGFTNTIFCAQPERNLSIYKQSILQATVNHLWKLEAAQIINFLY